VPESLQRMRSRLFPASLPFVLVVVALCGSSPGVSAPAGVAPAAQASPAGSYEALVSYGRDIIHDTPHYAGRYIRAGMSCEACHIDAGMKPHGGSFRGIYAKFPQWNKRAKRFIALQDRLAECFLYSMNGTPPAFTSKEMIALTAYIANASKGAPVGTGFPGQGPIEFEPDSAPSVTRGQAVYTTRCTACHGATGQGSAGFPPLWGPKSFNDGAGMHRIALMSAFVRYNMPFGSPPDTLSKQEAYDVSAFVLSHPRPKFDKKRAIAFPSQAAGTF
jgi:thiosulfate dehydrogenase